MLSSRSLDWTSEMGNCKAARYGSNQARVPASSKLMPNSNAFFVSMTWRLDCQPCFSRAPSSITVTQLYKPRGVTKIASGVLSRPARSLTAEHKQHNCGLRDDQDVKEMDWRNFQVTASPCRRGSEQPSASDFKNFKNPAGPIPQNH